MNWELARGEVKIVLRRTHLDRLVDRPPPGFAGRRTIIRALFAATTRGRLRRSGALLFGPRDVFHRKLR
jgi:hypothetical protein